MNVFNVQIFWDHIDSIQNFYRVYSGVNKYSADAVESFLKSIISTKKFPLTRLGNTNATEMAKVLENSYRAMNIAFITEWSRFAEDSSVNLYEVVEAIKMRPTHSNMMYPGIGLIDMTFTFKTSATATAAPRARISKIITAIRATAWASWAT